MDYFLCALRKYAQFDGRSSRSEFWYFVLFYFLLSLAVGLVDHMMQSGGILGFILTLAFLIPSISVTVRRLHDSDHSGWWYLILFVPVIGFFAILYFALLRSDPASNRFGPPPAR